MGINKKDKTNTEEAEWIEVCLQRAPKPIRNQGKASAKVKEKENIQSRPSEAVQVDFLATDDNGGKGRDHSGRVGTRTSVHQS